jgi:hypothetical protein
MRKLMMAALFALPMLGATALAEDILKIGRIDPFGERTEEVLRTEHKL